MKHLIDGRIPAGSACPWAERCAMRMERCPTTEAPRDAPFSCARARLAEMVNEPTDIERHRAAEGAAVSGGKRSETVALVAMMTRLPTGEPLTEEQWDALVEQGQRAKREYDGHREEIAALRDKAKRFRGWRVKATGEGCDLALSPRGVARTVAWASPVGLERARRIAADWRRMGREAQIVRVYRRAAPGTVGRGRG